MKENISSGNKIKKTNTPCMILVVEDDEGLSRLIQKNLQREGFQTEGAINGADAISFVVNNKNIVMLLDYRLPDMSGKRVIETLTERQCMVPFIIMTGHGDVMIAVEMMKLGARDYLVKDSEFLDVLPSIVNRFIEQLEIEKRLAETESKLKKTEEKYYNLIEFANAGIIVTEHGKITYVNMEAEKIYGYSKKELIGQSPSIMMLDKYKDRHRKMLDEMMKTGSAKQAIFEEEGVRKDGSLIPIEISFSLTHAGESAIIAVIRDISEKKRAEQEIRESKEFLEKIIQGSKDGIVVCDKMGAIISINKAMEEMLGYGKEEIIGRHSSELLTDDRSEKKKVLGKMEEYFEKGFVSYETRYKRKDGNYVDVECYSSLIKDDKGNIIAGVSIERDITERKKMQEQLLQSEKLKSLGELSGGVAHDFNNVLAAILGRVQLLKIQLKPPLVKQEKRKSVLEIKKGLEIIERASLDGAETVRRIQEFSRRRADDKDFTQVDINELVNNALEFTRIRWKNEAESKGIKIKIKKEFSPLNPSLGSSSELREVFTNLINNSIDAMPQGGEIRVESFMDDTNAVIRISDTGKGLSKDIRDRIFDPFFTTKDVQSTGLGLSVSYGIINRHRGTITVDSVEGEGTTFTIKFPITKKTGEWKVKEGKVIPIKRKHKKARILVIEDEEDVRELLRDILTDAGHNVEISADGNEGIKMFEKKKFDLVFTDLGMPGMSGWQVTEKIKSINDKVPVALITGWNIKLDESEMNDSRINFVVQKPFKMEQILNLVQEGMILRDQLKAV
jgi:PAS domain S-box-containing protein